MDPRSFIETAERLCKGAVSEADWRSSVSRAYYAVFLTLRTILRDNIPEPLLIKRGCKPRKIPHQFLIWCLANNKENRTKQLGAELRSLEAQRCRADYDINEIVSKQHAHDALDDARALFEDIDAISPQEIARHVRQFLEGISFRFSG
jgi:uncharacterized protein (UPF0332 family)